MVLLSVCLVENVSSVYYDEDVPYQIAAQVLDSHWRDAARQEFKKTERFSLENLQCRPAEVTLRTAPGFYATMKVPAKPAD